MDKHRHSGAAVPCIYLNMFKASNWSVGDTKLAIKLPRNKDYPFIMFVETISCGYNSFSKAMAFKRKTMSFWIYTCLLITLGEYKMRIELCLHCYITPSSWYMNIFQNTCNVFLPLHFHFQSSWMKYTFIFSMPIILRFIAKRCLKLVAGIWPCHMVVNTSFIDCSHL